MTTPRATAVTVKVRPTMRGWVDQYMERMELNKLSERHLHNNRHVLRRFAHWVDGCNPRCDCTDRRMKTDPRTLTPDLIREWWYGNIAKRDISSETWMGYRSIIKGFMTHLDGERLVDDTRGLATAIPKCKADRVDRIWLPANTLEKILASADSPWIRIVLALMIFHLPRQGEERELRFRDIDLTAGKIRWYMSKPNRTIIIPISKRLDKELRAWMTWHSENIGPTTPDSFVIPQRQRAGRTGKFTYTPDRKMGDLGRVVKPYIESFLPEGVKYDGRCHCLRRSAADALLNYLEAHVRDGGQLAMPPLEIVSEMLGHANTTITLRYLDRNARNQRAMQEMEKVGDFLPDPAGITRLGEVRAARAS